VHGGVGALVQAAFSMVLAPSLCSVSSGVLRKLRDGFYIPLKGACPACLEEVSIIMEDGTREVRTVAQWPGFLVLSLARQQAFEPDETMLSLEHTP
jgi:hypothetical protein